MEQEVEKARWSSPEPRGKRPRSKAARWTRESCIQSWTRCAALLADASGTRAKKPGRNFNKFSDSDANRDPLSFLSYPS